MLCILFVPHFLVDNIGNFLLQVPVVIVVAHYKNVGTFFLFFWGGRVSLCGALLGQSPNIYLFVENQVAVFQFLFKILVESFHNVLSIICNIISHF